MIRALIELVEIDQILICRQPLQQRSLRVELRRAEQLQTLLDVLGCSGLERGG